MPSKLPKFTMRTNQETLDKLRFIAEFNFRTINKELEAIVSNHIKDFEKEHGPIVIPETWKE